MHATCGWYWKRIYSVGVDDLIWGRPNSRVTVIPPEKRGYYPCGGDNPVVYSQARDRVIYRAKRLSTFDSLALGKGYGRNATSDVVPTF